jgi:hypothetical protein
MFKKNLAICLSAMAKKLSKKLLSLILCEMGMLWLSELLIQEFRTAVIQNMLNKLHYQGGSNPRRRRSGIAK